MSRPTLYNWKNQLLGREVPASMKRPADPPPETQREELERQLESLRRDVRNLQLEHDLLKKANELLKKGLGVDLQLLTNREKTLLVDGLRQTHALPDLLARLELARSSYFYHRARLEVADKYVEVRHAMADIFERNYRCYGYRRLHASLSNQSVNISEKVVRRLMKPTKNALKSWHRDFERCCDLPMGYVRSKPKYSVEQKKLAVDHYLGHGRCLIVTIKALGHPGRDTLAAWIAELHPETANRLVGRAGSVSRPAALKRAAVIQLCSRQGSGKCGLEALLTLADV